MAEHIALLAHELQMGWVRPSNRFHLVPGELKNLKLVANI